MAVAIAARGLGHGDLGTTADGLARGMYDVCGSVPAAAAGNSPVGWRRMIDV
jgi:hypothetical protein